VAIFIDEPDAPVYIDRRAVAEAFRLTRRETEIATLVGEGYELSRIANTLELGVGTVRNHLKRVFSKTDQHSQAALAALIRGFPGARQ
jgi:DNA-binding CsgD family transcriptional regulator